MKLVTVLGARPQFVKASAVSACLREGNEFSNLENVLVHTGQHFDHQMSQVFFDELQIDERTIHLNISGGSHGRMTGLMLEAIETVLVTENPDCVLVYGDTNSTLAAALAASKLGVPIAHVEAGLRSFNRAMPEEINRVVTDHLSAHLYCPTAESEGNLAREGITKGVRTFGDVMFDVALRIGGRSDGDAEYLNRLNLTANGFGLATIHRAENTDAPHRLKQILQAMDELAKHLPILFPIHPRTKAAVAKYDLGMFLRNIQVVEPVGLSDMMRLERLARYVLTDSGGVQKEAYFFGTPCITARDETEWVETVDSGWNRIVGASHTGIVEAALHFETPTERPQVYGDGTSSRQILLDLQSHYSS